MADTTPPLSNERLPKPSPERDLEIINANADELNQEAEDALEYQIDW